MKSFGVILDSEVNFIPQIKKYISVMIVINKDGNFTNFPHRGLFVEGNSHYNEEKMYYQYW